jgi:hypothetical protein
VNPMNTATKTLIGAALLTMAVFAVSGDAAASDFNYRIVTNLGCTVNVGSCSGNCAVNVGSCTGSCIVNVGSCGKP